MTVAAAPPFTGVVLTGGASRRMGRDKALIEVDGRSLARVAVDALRDAGAAQVLCIGGDLGALRRAGLEAVADLHPGEGPLGALITALTLLDLPAGGAGAAGSGGVLHVLTCDLPAVDASVVRPVQEALAAAPAAAIAAPRLDGRLQYLSAAYRSAAVRATASQAFTQGERAVRAGLAGLPVVAVDGLDPGKLADVDTPERLAAVRRPTGPARRGVHHAR